MSDSIETSQHVPESGLESAPNTTWHVKHSLPEHPALEQRITWHMEHARNCSCPPLDGDILEELKKRYTGKHQDFWIYFNRNDHRALALWAAEYAEHLLPYFEEKYPEDTRPRDAIRTLREWVATGRFSMPVIRRASLSAHAAARDVQEEDKAACFAARAAGQAVGTAHVPTHALGPAFYAARLIAVAHPTDVKAAMAKEREWQRRHLPDNLREWVDSWMQKTQQLLPKDLRTQLD